MKKKKKKKKKGIHIERFAVTLKVTMNVASSSQFKYYNIYFLV